MNPEMDQHIVLNSNSKDYYKTFYNNNNITNVIDFKNGKELLSYFKKEDFNKKLKLDNHNLRGKNKNNFDVSISVSVAVTALARVYMSKIKNLPDLTLYYSDTDSAIINKPLNPKLVGTELGLFKLEYVFDKGLFLCPKVYAMQWKDEKGDTKEVIKVKGLKTPVNLNGEKLLIKNSNDDPDSIGFNELKVLLTKNNIIENPQGKWYRSFSDAYISIKDETYTLMLTDNKRKLIYKDNIFINTEPYIYEDNKIINLD